MSKIRLDQYLCQNGLVQSRERAKALIMSGIVFVNEQKADKAGEMIAPDAKVEVRGHDIGYVSRGGLKLEKAMQVFPMRPDGKVCMDIGASTGGFTDCMLQNGAVKVYAVDVGYGQLAWSLRTDERVVNMERTNIRNVKPEDLSEPVAFFSVDVSFISLKHIFPVADTICTPEAVGVCLVKPQFEAGREKVGKKGVVRDPATHRESEVRKKRLHFGLVFQNFNLFPQYTALQNITLAGELLAKEKPEYKANRKAIHAELEEKARTLLAQMGLSERENHYPHQLSGGQQQRVAIARALALEPDILCFDEPTSALDPELTGEVLRVLRDLADQKTTMIIVTHEMSFARDVADRILFMDGGVVVEEGPAHQVIEHPHEERTKQFLSHYGT